MPAPAADPPDVRGHRRQRPAARTSRPTAPRSRSFVAAAWWPSSRRARAAWTGSCASRTRVSPSSRPAAAPPILPVGISGGAPLPAAASQAAGLRHAADDPGRSAVHRSTLDPALDRRAATRGRHGRDHAADRRPRRRRPARPLRGRRRRVGWRSDRAHRAELRRGRGRGRAGRRPGRRAHPPRQRRQHRLRRARRRQRPRSSGPSRWPSRPGPRSAPIRATPTARASADGTSTSSPPRSRRASWRRSRRSWPRHDGERRRDAPRQGPRRALQRGGDGRRAGRRGRPGHRARLARPRGRRPARIPPPGGRRGRGHARRWPRASPIAPTSRTARSARGRCPAPSTPTRSWPRDRPSSWRPRAATRRSASTATRPARRRSRPPCGRRSARPATRSRAVRGP